ncbi:MAG: hypothetical protein WC867_02300 [Candidatus Pacearchaeota archaeon]|jgi:hypothetical protein
MAKISGALIIIFFLIMLVNIYSGSNYIMERYEINKIKYLSHNEYTIGKVKDFCGISKIDHYYKDRNACCSSKLSCGNGKKATWNINSQICTC